MRKVTEPTAVLSCRLRLSDAQRVADLARAAGDPTLSSTLRDLVCAGLATKTTTGAMKAGAKTTEG